MKITIFGCGYVGLVTGACLADFGNDVCFVDVDRRRVEELSGGTVHIHEPGLSELLLRNLHEGRVSFTTNARQGVLHGDLLFIAVGTPPQEDGSADLQHVLTAVGSIAQHMDERFRLIINKSTVPVGTADKVRSLIDDTLRRRGMPQVIDRYSVVSNPEFLKEGAAISDFMRPDRIVLGLEHNHAGLRARAMMKQLYGPLTQNHDRILCMDLRSAELTKYAANAMLATRISFMNELAGLAEALGADIELVRKGIGSDPRIGYSFLYAGAGYGGSCFPKDVQALRRTAAEHGRTLHVIDAVEYANRLQKKVIVDKIVREFGERLDDLHFALWGLAFKPNTDDMREAPSLDVIAGLAGRGARLSLYDPVAQENARRVLEERLPAEHFRRITFCAGQMAALTGADGLIIMTEWKTFRSPDYEAIRAALRRPYIFDGRNLYDPGVMREHGLRYRSIGRNARQI